MIVVDANILIYSLIEGGYSPLVHKLRERDVDWGTTGLCLHEGNYSGRKKLPRQIPTPDTNVQPPLRAGRFASPFAKGGLRGI